MSRWQEIRFEDIYEIPSRNGLTRPSSVRGEGYNFINMGELFACDRIYDIETELVKLNEKEKRDSTLQEGDLLFARQSLVFEGAGKCSVVMNLRNITSFESHLIRVRLNKTIAAPLFYYYYFSLPYNAVKTIVQQCAQAGIRGTDLAKIKVPHPDLPTQKRIADILSAYDDLIENNNKRIALLEKAAQELYKEWFVRFRFPGHEKSKLINGLPEGWELKKIGDVCKIKSGYAFKSEWWTDDGVSVIKIKDIQNNTIDLTDLSMVSTENAKKANQFKTVPGDLLIAMTGATIGKLALVPKTDNVMLVNQRVGKFFFDSEKKQTENVGYIYFTMQQKWIQELILMISGSNAAQPNISPFDLEKIKIVYNGPIIEKYNCLASNYIDMILKLQEENQNLIKQRDLLLPRLMSGKLEV